MNKLEQINRAVNDIREMVGASCTPISELPAAVAEWGETNIGGGFTSAFVFSTKQSPVIPNATELDMETGLVKDLGEDWFQTTSTSTTRNSLQQTNTIWLTYAVFNSEGVRITEWMTPVNIKGAPGTAGSDGEKGEQGDKGDQGEPGITYRTVMAYTTTDTTDVPQKPYGGVWNITSNVVTDIQSVDGCVWTTDASEGELKYRWISENTFDMSGSPIGEWSAPFRITGEDGENGVDGTNIEFIYRQLPSMDIYTSLSAWLETNELEITETGVVPETKDSFTNTKWTASPSGISEENPIEVVCTRQKNEESWGKWSNCVLWAKWGEDGTDGDGVEYIYLITPTKTEDGTPITSDIVKTSAYMPDRDAALSNSAYQENEFCFNSEFGYSDYHWTDEPSDVGPYEPLEWVSIRKKENGTWGKFSDPKLWAKWAKDGEPGQDGASVKIEGKFATIADIQSAWTTYVESDGHDVSAFFNGSDGDFTISLGDGWFVEEDGKVYVYTSQWTTDSESNEFNDYWISIVIRGVSGYTLNLTNDVITVPLEEDGSFDQDFATTEPITCDIELYGENGLITENVQYSINQTNNVGLYLENNKVIFYPSFFTSHDLALPSKITCTAIYNNVILSRDILINVTKNAYELLLEKSVLHYDENGLIDKTIKLEVERWNSSANKYETVTSGINVFLIIPPINGNSHQIRQATFNDNLWVLDIEGLNVQNVSSVKIYVGSEESTSTDVYAGNYYTYENIAIVTNGKDGQDGVGVFKSTVFKRTNTILTDTEKPVGGSFSNPVPTGWSDGIPTGEEILWASTATFSSDGSKDVDWSTPAQMTDTHDFEIIYSSKETPAAPGGNFAKDADGKITEWLKSNPDWTDDGVESSIWMATIKAANGVWGDWSVTKIKGEKGEDGVNGAGYLKNLLYDSANLTVSNGFKKFLLPVRVSTGDVFTFKAERAHKIEGSSSNFMVDLWSLSDTLLWQRPTVNLQYDLPNVYQTFTVTAECNNILAELVIYSGKADSHNATVNFTNFSLVKGSEPMEEWEDYKGDEGLVNLLTCDYNYEGNHNSYNYFNQNDFTINAGETYTLSWEDLDYTGTNLPYALFTVDSKSASRNHDQTLNKGQGWCTLTIRDYLQEVGSAAGTRLVNNLVSKFFISNNSSKDATATIKGLSLVKGSRPMMKWKSGKPIENGAQGPQGPSGADGQPGADAIILDLTNDSEMVPCDGEGKVDSTWSTQTTMTLYKGSTPVTEGVTYKVNGETVTSNIVTINKNYVSELSSKVKCEAVYNGVTYTKEMTLTKAIGVTAYRLVPSATTIRRDKNGNFTPPSVNATVMGWSNGKWVKATQGTVQYSSDDINWSTTPVSPSNSIKNIYIRLLANDGTTVLDKETIPIIWDGTDGQPGGKGDPGVSPTITKKYCLSINTTEPTNEEFIHNTPQVTTPSNKYGWCMETLTQASGTTTNKYIISVHGETGPAGVGSTGAQGPIIYPAGAWRADASYSHTIDANGNITATPYVFWANADTKADAYYKLLTNVTGSSNPTPNNDSQHWQKIEYFDSIFADVGMFNQATVGQFVFHKNYVFSQEGVDASGVAKTYNDYSDPASAIESGTFKPNILFNAVTGEGNLKKVSVEKVNTNYKTSGGVDASIVITGQEITMKNGDDANGVTTIGSKEYFNKLQYYCPVFVCSAIGTLLTSSYKTVGEFQTSGDYYQGYGGKINVTNIIGKFICQTNNAGDTLDVSIKVISGGDSTVYEKTVTAPIDSNGDYNFTFDGFVAEHNNSLVVQLKHNKSGAGVQLKLDKLIMYNTSSEIQSSYPQTFFGKDGCLILSDNNFVKLGASETVFMYGSCGIRISTNGLEKTYNGGLNWEQL